MARYKDYSYDQQKLPPVRYSEQILPGTFEYTLGYVIDHELDLSVFDGRYRNDEGGAPAYDPAHPAKDHLVRLLAGRGLLAAHRKPLPRERGNDGALGRHPATLDHGQ